MVQSSSPFRWYLTTDADVSYVKMRLMDGGMLTDLDEVSAGNGMLSPYFYDLSGRKIEKEKMQRGIYIINGKKILVK